MGFKNMKRDDHGHVIGNDETDGQECQHASGQSDKVEDQKYNKEMKEAQEQNAAMSEAFDDDYEEEFEDDLAGHALEAVESELHIDVLESKENLDDAKRWLVANGYAKTHMAAQDLIESALSDEGKAKLNNLLGFGEDDDILDEEFGKNTPERELVGAIKEGKPEDFAKKTAKMPNGKEMSLFDFAHNITNYLDVDTASAIIAAKFGVSENDAKAYLESPYNREGSKEDYKRKLNGSNKKQKYKEINGIIYPVDSDGKIDRDNKFPDLKAFKDVYGENVEEDK